MLWRTADINDDACCHVGILSCWCIVMLVYCCVGVLSCWCIVVLVYFHVGVLSCWCIVVLVYCHVGVLSCWFIVVLVYCCVGVLLCWCMIVTNAIAAVAIVLASAVVASVFIATATTTIAQRHCPQHSHYSGCRHHPPLQHSNRTGMAWAMAMEAMATAMRVVDKQWWL